MELFNETLTAAPVVAVAVDYGMVLTAVIADLVSGIARARREARPCTSRGLRRTVDKLSRYYLTLFSLTAVDAVIVAATICLNLQSGTSLPVIPVLTTLGALGLGLIEVKSIAENTACDSDFDNAARIVRRLVRLASRMPAEQRRRLLDMIEPRNKPKS